MTAPISLICIRTGAHKASYMLRSRDSYKVRRSLVKGAQVQKKYTRESKFFSGSEFIHPGKTLPMSTNGAQ